jgi:hypothetical protein
MFGGGDFVRRWSPRIGDVAADLYPRAALLIAVGGAMVPLWVLERWVGSTIGSNPVQATGIALALVDIAVLIAGFVSAHRVFKAMSLFLGVQVSLWNSPTFRDRDWQRWCDRNGIPSGPPLP